MICEVGSGMLCYWRCFFLPLCPFLPSKFKKVMQDFSVILLFYGISISVFIFFLFFFIFDLDHKFNRLIRVNSGFF